ncbi:MAG: 3-hydroxyacyl-[acyl-carrier-protein] dehydratase FabA, partial [Deltaproteobacteria bacterium]|nr:3-hydroxyacyl-[acyl-carrier-protein] dehydratase FabA [Deltaproteobacteria bacterium]
MFKKIAVIGLSCLFPDAKNPEEFFENLLNYKESTRFATEKQMGVDPKVFFHPSKGKPDKYYNTRGGYIDDFSFDPTGYDLPPETLDNLDDLYKWSLYVSREALNDSGYLNHQSALKECGVVLGNLSFPTKSSNQIYIPFYHKPLEEVLQKLLNNNKISLVDDEKLDNISTSNSRISGFPSSLISQALSLSGTHLSLDAACASSLYSVKIACDYISSGRAKMMLAGAVSAADPFFVSMGFSTFQAYPQNSDSSPLDQSSKGLFAGEGAGMFVLKELSEAVKDKDKIYAVISGVGLSNDGRGKFVLSPKKEGQQKAYERAYQNSEIKPDEIKYIECHATGTPLGDVTELESLDQFFGQYHKQMYVGSVKSNFGHLLTAAGMASMLKVILSMNKGIIPATIKIENPLQSPNAVVSQDSVVSKNHPWPSGIKKVAGVNAFGFGGTNAHLIFEEINSATSALKTKIKPHENAQLSIIGMDAIFGKINGLKAFNSLIYSGDDCLIPLPKNRWSGIATKNAFSLAEGFGIDLDHLPEGGYIEHFDFDYLRFRIPPNPADPLIPQQLLMLKAADNAIRDAGLSAGGNVGVIIAMETEVNLHQFRGRVELDYKIKEALEAQGLSLSDQELSDLEVMAKDALLNPVGVNQYTSFIGNIMACRVSSLWDFSGPAYTVSSDESSVFKAIETAMMMLESGEVEAVIVGAVDLSGSPEEVFIKSVITPKAGNEAKVMGFEKGSKGWTVGEGAGAIVLKRTDLAIKDQDRIYANIDALGSGYLESKESRGKTAQKALKIADISPESVSMIEVEASGDLWKAKSEIESLKTAYDLKSHQKIALGSHKANIGHCFAASGIASVIKTALCVYHRYIPANPGWNEPKEELEIELTSFYFPYESKSWLLESHQKKRIAAVNNIAQDGTLSHLILSESTKPQPRSLEIINELPFYFLPFSSETSEELITILANSLKLIENTDELKSLVVDLRRKTLAKPQQSYSIAILGHDKKELSEEIKSAILAVPKAIHSKSEWMTPLGSYFTGNPLGQKGKMVFVYPGGFNSYIGMQKDLLVLFPELMDFIPSYTNNPHLTFRDGLINPKTVKKTENSDIKRFQNSLI